MRSLALLLALSVSGFAVAACGSDDEIPFGDSDAGGSGGSGSSEGSGATGATTGEGGETSSPASSSTGTGGCPGLGDACTDCEAQSCQETYCACYANPSCVNLAACGAGCAANDLACFQTCWTANPDGISDGALLVDCAASSCSAGCPGLTPLTPCQKCLYQQCPAPMNKCVANADCVALLYCLGACTNEACYDGCYAQHPGGVEDVTPVGECSQVSCTAACG